MTSPHKPLRIPPHANAAPHARIMAWLDYLKSLPAWQAIERRMRAVRQRAREFATALRARWPSWR